MCSKQLAMSTTSKEMKTVAPTNGVEKEVENGHAVATEANGRAVLGDMVDWAGEDEVERPMNWTNKRKAKQIVVICYNTFLTYVVSLDPM